MERVKGSKVVQEVVPYQTISLVPYQTISLVRRFLTLWEECTECGRDLDQRIGLTRLAYAFNTEVSDHHIVLTAYNLAREATPQQLEEMNRLWVIHQLEGHKSTHDYR